MPGKVLVVEDSPTQAQSLLVILESAGFEAELASSGEEALEKVEQDRFDIIVSDVMMPGISGYDLCGIVKSRATSREIPVLLLTSLSDPMAIIRGLECGADNYVTKPYTPEHIVTRIRHALDRYALRPARRTTMGVNVSFLGSTFTINSEREQILDLFLSSIEDVVRTNEALLTSQRALAAAQEKLRAYASRMKREANVSAEKYATLLQCAEDAILVVDAHGRIEEANQRASDLLGKPQEELCGRTLSEFAHPDGRSLLEAQLMRSGGSTARASNVELKPCSAARRMFVDLTISRKSADDSDSALVILHDVTERREAEERIRRSEVQLAAAQRVAGLGSLEWDLVTDQITWSEHTAEIFGRDSKYSPTFDTVASQVHPEDSAAFRRDVKLAAAGKGGYEGAYRIIRADGSVRHLQVRREVYRDEKREPVRILSTMLDITDRMELEEQLRQSQKMEAIGQLAGGIAHDFNNLITVISSYSEITMAALDKDSPLRNDVAQIRRAGESAASLTRQLLAFSRKQVVKPQLLSLSQTVDGLRRMLERLLGEEIGLDFDLAATGGLVLADPTQIEQLVLNLSVNARDAMPGGGRLKISTGRLEIPPDGSEVHPELCPGSYEVLTVADAGAGMDAMTQSRIFEPFFTTKPTGQGTGLGLSTVYGITKQAGGDITVTSAPGQGSTFTIFLPTAAESIESEEEQIDAVPGAPKAPPDAAATTVLLVEDETAVRTLIARVLRREGYDVIEAASGPAALSVAKDPAQAIDLVISDVVMPEMSGPAMFDTIAASRKNTRAIFISGYTHDDVLRRGMQDPGVTFLAKPFGPKQLLEAVAAVLT